MGNEIQDVSKLVASERMTNEDENLGDITATHRVRTGIKVLQQGDSVVVEEQPGILGEQSVGGVVDLEGALSGRKDDVDDSVDLDQQPAVISLVLQSPTDSVDGQLHITSSQVNKRI